MSNNEFAVVSSSLPCGFGHFFICFALRFLFSILDFRLSPPSAVASRSTAQIFGSIIYQQVEAWNHF
jgi:hypothetical protein